jgi:molybdopterin molybdotransferase/putative molybdopterin biosynthesis protein
MERNIYLDNVPLDEALGRWLELCRAEGVTFPLPAVEVPTGQAAGMVTAEPLFARVSSPPFHSSAMDGVAVRAESTYGASETSPVTLRLGTEIELIDTGEPLPAGFDAVIMVEDLNEVGDETYEVIKPASPWQYVRPLGEDIVQTELVLPRGHRVRPVDIGALLNAGFTAVPVRRRPVVSVIPTGTELVEDPADLGPGKVMESNSWTLAAFARAAGAEPGRMNLIRDDYGLIKDAVASALEASDVVVVNAGTSAGREDFTRAIIEELGSVAVHGVAMRPGKPVVLGAARGTPVIGLPGFPVANYRGAQEFLGPMLAELQGLPAAQGARLKARLARKLFSAPGFDEFVQVKLGRVDDEVVAVPLARGSGVSMSLVRSDGVVRVPPESEGIERWREVSVILHDPDMNIDGTILAIGSHDVSLDLLASRIRQEDASLSLASANVGSMGGIMAIRQGQAHIAGTHLLDPDTGEFNVPYVLRQLTGDEVLLVTLGLRSQGLMVPRGNPRGIRGIEDLSRSDVLIVNRQKGSGTRLLLDYRLNQEGIDPGGVAGYEREVFTHTAVAAAVAGGTADTGLGVLAAAKALGLEFIPVASERYDLLVLRSFARTRGYRALMSALRDRGYRREVEALGGYDLSGSGDEVPLEGD